MSLMSSHSALDASGAHSSLAGLVRSIFRSAAARLRRLLVAARPDGKRRIVLVFDLEATPTPGDDSGVEFRELTVEEIQQRRESLGPGVDTQLSGNDNSGCVVGMFAGRQVYHAWYIRGDGSRLHGIPGDWTPRGRVLFLHDGYTEPAFRGRGIHSAATRWMLARERGTDVTHAVCVVHADNVAAHRAVRKLGFRALGRIR
jgi:RimJ/RimL family protein N-acetyltransferase